MILPKPGQYSHCLWTRQSRRKKLQLAFLLAVGEEMILYSAWSLLIHVANCKFFERIPICSRSLYWIISACHEVVLFLKWWHEPKAGLFLCVCVCHQTIILARSSEIMWAGPKNCCWRSYLSMEELQGCWSLWACGAFLQGLTGQVTCSLWHSCLLQRFLLNPTFSLAALMSSGTSPCA